jgi:hypothetical protein
MIFLTERQFELLNMNSIKVSTFDNNKPRRNLLKMLLDSFVFVGQCH